MKAFGQESALVFTGADYFPKLSNSSRVISVPSAVREVESTGGPGSSIAKYVSLTVPS
jgi:hypothetical protein